MVAVAVVVAVVVAAAAAARVTAVAERVAAVAAVAELAVAELAVAELATGTKDVMGSQRSFPGSLAISSQEDSFPRREPWVLTLARRGRLYGR